MLRSCYIVVVDGTHASGKTTLLHALCSALKELGHHAGLLIEPARDSPLVDDVVLHQRGDFDICLEIELFATHLRNLARATRKWQIILADRSPINVVTYAKILDVGKTDWDGKMLEAMTNLALTWHQSVDLTFLTQDCYAQESGGDMMRKRVLHLQGILGSELRGMYQEEGHLVTIPKALTTAQRVAFCLKTMSKGGII